MLCSYLKLQLLITPPRMWTGCEGGGLGRDVGGGEGGVVWVTGRQDVEALTAPFTMLLIRAQRPRGSAHRRATPA